MARVVCTIEARMGSTRLPGKVLRPLCGAPMLARIVERIRRARMVDEIVIATVDNAENLPIVELARALGVGVFCGDENDVLGRVVKAAKSRLASTIVALTGDNPFVDPGLVDDEIRFLEANDLDYTSTTHMHFTRHWAEERTFPRGISVQVIRASALAEVDAQVTDPRVREHTAMALYDRSDAKYCVRGFHALGAYAAWHAPELRMTVDTPEDFEVAALIYGSLLPRNPAFSTLAAIQLLKSRPDWQQINSHVSQKLQSG